MFGRRKKGNGGRVPPADRNPYEGLRRQILDLTPGMAGVDPGLGPEVVYAAVFDWRLERAVATAVAVADGTASLYWSTGGGVIGAGSHESVRQAAGVFIASFQPFLHVMERDEAGDLPPVGMSHLRALTPNGRFVASAPTDELAHGRHPMSPVLDAAQGLITAIRLATPAQPS